MVDYFLWDEVLLLAEKRELESQPSEKVTLNTACGSKLQHDEIKEKLAAVGELLGFKAAHSWGISTGAIAEALREARFGNLGKTFYVFEIQPRGSIDIKSKNNFRVILILPGGYFLMFNCKEPKEMSVARLRALTHHIRVVNQVLADRRNVSGTLKIPCTVR